MVPPTTQLISYVVRVYRSVNLNWLPRAKKQDGGERAAEPDLGCRCSYATQ